MSYDPYAHAELIDLNVQRRPIDTDVEFIPSQNTVVFREDMTPAEERSALAVQIALTETKASRSPCKGQRLLTEVKALRVAAARLIDPADVVPPVNPEKLGVTPLIFRIFAMTHRKLIGA